jgi:hypothetical protein
MESADGIGQLEGDLLDRVDNCCVFFDHAGMLRESV